VAYRKNSFRFDPSYPVEAILTTRSACSPEQHQRFHQREGNLRQLLARCCRASTELGYRLSDFNGRHREHRKALFTWKALDQVSFRGGYRWPPARPTR
jgi:hypothetical protein